MKKAFSMSETKPCWNPEVGTLPLARAGGTRALERGPQAPSSTRQPPRPAHQWAYGRPSVNEPTTRHSRHQGLCHKEHEAACWGRWLCWFVVVFYVEWWSCFKWYGEQVGVFACGWHQH